MHSNLPRLVVAGLLATAFSAGADGPAASLQRTTHHTTLPKVTAGVERVRLAQAEARRLSAVAVRTPLQIITKDPPYVVRVNGQPFASTWIVPGAPYVFEGKGFGTVKGQVKLIGAFPRSAPQFRIDLWQDTVIHAYLEDNITGAYDQEDVTLSITAPQLTVTHDNVKFLAMRELKTIDLAPYLGRDSGEFIHRQVSHRDGFFRVEGQKTWEVAASKTMEQVAKEQHGYETAGCFVKDENIHFKPGGTDEFQLPAFKRGWAFVGFEWYIGRTDEGKTDYKGDPGRRVTKGKYELEVVGTKLRLHWATFNSLTEKPCDYQALAATFYEAKAYVEGPRGTDPL
jgi:hypothetical protein